MAKLEVAMRTAFYAPTQRRWYFTAKAAARQEAAARIRKKYPTENYEPDTGHYWHWNQDERLCRVHARLTRLLLASLGLKAPA